MKTKKLLLLYIALLIVAIFLMVFLLNLKRPTHKEVTLPRDFNNIRESGELNVVTDYNSIGYYVSGDSVTGFQYELIKAIEQRWGLKVNLFLENSLDENLNGLLEGQYDIVARNIPVNAPLREKFNFTESIGLNKQVLVQRRAEFNDGTEPIRQHLDLAKKTIYVAENSPVILRLQNLSHEIGDTIFVEQNETYEAEQLVMMVAGGDIDFTVCDEIVAKQLSEKLPEIDIETAVGFTQLESWAVRKNSPILLDSINSFFDNFRSSKEFREMYEKYY